MVPFVAFCYVCGCIIYYDWEQALKPPFQFIIGTTLFVGGEEFCRWALLTPGEVHHWDAKTFNPSELVTTGVIYNCKWGFPYEIGLASIHCVTVYMTVMVKQ